MKNELISQLNKPVITKLQQQALFAGGWLASWVSRILIVSVILIVLVFVGHYTGFEEWIRVFTGVEQ